MRHYTMTDSEARRKLRPVTSSDRRQLATLVAYTLITVILVGALRSLIVRNHERRIQAWPNVNATILDTRTIPAGWWTSRLGNKLAYDVQVLIHYSAAGVPRERWVTVQQQPRTREDAALEIFRWKGQTCLVHWNPKNPDEIIADIS